MDNFVANLFPQIEVKKHGTIIDEVDFAGVTSTVQGCVSYSGPSECNGKAFNSGFNKFAHEGQTFNAVGRLGDLGLGFFKDITVPIYKGGFEITFTRNSNNNALFRWKGKKVDGTEDPSTLPAEGKVTINTFYLRVPIIEYNSDAKTNLVNDLFKENYVFQFKKWQCIQHMKVTGKSLTADITNIYRSIQNHIWAFVFQTNQLNNQQKDNKAFDHSDVKNLWIEVSGRRYPEETLDLDWDTDKFCLVYNAYLDYKRVFDKTTGSIQYINIKDFKSLYPIYSIDLTDQPRKISDVESNIILHVDFNKAVPTRTGTDEGNVCYIIVVSKNLLLYEPIKNKISEIKLIRMLLLLFL